MSGGASIRRESTATSAAGVAAGGVVLGLLWRYLKPGRKFVSVIMLVSLLGVALGVLMMIVVRSVMGGFEAEFRQQLVAGRPHVLLRGARAEADGWPSQLKGLEGLEGVSAATPFVGGVVYASGQAGESAMMCYALPAPGAGAQGLAGKLRSQLVEGQWPQTLDEIALPSGVMERNSLKLGMSLQLYSDRAVNAALASYSRASRSESQRQRDEAMSRITLHSRSLRICGVLESGLLGEIAVASLEAGQKLFDLGVGVSGLALELNNPMEVEAWLKRHEAALKGWQIEPWTVGEEARLAAMRNEQSMMQFVLAIIALVAAFSVMNVTITVTTQKRQEIGVLSALGARPSQIVGIFVGQATAVGVLGSVLGAAGALAVLTWREELRRGLALLLGAEVHEMDGVFLAHIPAVIDPLQVALTCVISLLLCVGAGLAPAWLAARVQCAEALRDR